MKNLVFSVFLFGSVMASAQTSLNDYKYVIVPKRFEAFKKVNQYQTSTLVKHLFAQNGFNAVYDDEMPDDLNSNRCLGLVVEFEDGSSLFTTKGAITLTDCNSKEVFKSLQGKSKEKDYKIAYNEVIRDAFASFKAMNYAYSGKAEEEVPITVSFKNDVKRVEDKKMKEPKNKISEAVVKREATAENQTFKSVEPKELNIPVNPPVTKKAVPSLTNTATGEVLYAQQISNGYQLVDSAPKILMRIYTTSAQGVYMAQKEEIRGILFNMEGHWIFEYYDGGVLKSEELNIKF